MGVHGPVHGQTFLEEALDHRLVVKAGQEIHCVEQEAPVGVLLHSLHAAVKDAQDFWHLKGRRRERMPQRVLSPYFYRTQTRSISSRAMPAPLTRCQGLVLNFTMPLCPSPGSQVGASVPLARKHARALGCCTCLGPAVPGAEHFAYTQEMDKFLTKQPG